MPKQTHTHTHTVPVHPHIMVIVGYLVIHSIVLFLMNFLMKFPCTLFNVASTPQPIVNTSTHKTLRIGFAGYHHCPPIISFL